jgi:two-component system, LytTR family, response regulator
MADSARVSALIVDDEPIARAGLRRMLADVEWIECAGEAATGTAAIAAIRELRPELVFLDIEMPELSGIDVMRAIEHPPHVIFTTAYSEHAVTAFELGAIDYLLKPFGPERLQSALERVRAALGEPRANLADRVSEALARGPMSRLFVRTGRSIVPVAISSVAWFEAVGDYVAAHVGTTQHLLHVALNRLEERLDARRYLRIHRAHIVNLDHVRAFRRQLDGRVVAELLDGTQLGVSRARAQELRDLTRQ